MSLPERGFAFLRESGQSTAKTAIAVISANTSHRVMMSNHRPGFEVRVAPPQASGPAGSRPFNPKRRLRFTSRPPMHATDNNRGRRDIGKRLGCTKVAIHAGGTDRTQADTQQGFGAIAHAL